MFDSWLPVPANYWHRLLRWGLLYSTPGSFKELVDSCQVQHRYNWSCFVAIWWVRRPLQVLVSPVFCDAAAHSSGGNFQWNKIQEAQSLWLLNRSCKIQGFAHISLKAICALKKSIPDCAMLKSSILWLKTVY